MKPIMMINAILLKSLADRFAEAFAERMHERMRKEWWGYVPDEKLDNVALIDEKYLGIRPAPGYPACPNHTEKKLLFDLLQVNGQVSITLTESMATVAELTRLRVSRSKYVSGGECEWLVFLTS